MASLCKSQQCSIERRGFRQELDSWRHKLIHCVGFETILEGLFGPALLNDLSLFKDCEPTGVCDWSFDENCLFCCLRREKVKEHLAGFHKPINEPGQENFLKQEQAKIIRLERQAEEFINAVFYKKDSPRISDPNIPLVAREIMQRMIRQFAAEYTSKNSSTQDSSPPDSTKNQSLPKSPSGQSSPPPATTQNPVLSKLLMADQDSPLDLTVKKPHLEEPCEQADGVLDLSTKKSPRSGSPNSSLSPSTSNTIGNGTQDTEGKAIDPNNSTSSSLENFMAKLCSHHQKQFILVLNNLCTEESLMKSKSRSASVSQIANANIEDYDHFRSDRKANLSFEKNTSVSESCLNCQVSRNNVTDLHEDNYHHGMSHCSEVLSKLPISSDSKVDHAINVSHVTDQFITNNHVGIPTTEEQMGAFYAKISEGSQTVFLEHCVLSHSNSALNMTNDSLGSNRPTDFPKIANKENSQYINPKQTLLDCNDCKLKHDNSVTTVMVKKLGNLCESPFQNLTDHPGPALQNIRLHENKRLKTVQCKNSQVLMTNDCDKQCDVVYISEPITTECHFEKSVVCPRNTARKSTRGYLFSGDCCELSTVRTLVRSSKVEENGNSALHIAEALIIPNGLIEALPSTDVVSLIHVEEKRVETDTLNLVPQNDEMRKIIPDSSRSSESENRDQNLATVEEPVDLVSDSLVAVFSLAQDEPEKAHVPINYTANELGLEEPADEFTNTKLDSSVVNIEAHSLPVNDCKKSVSYLAINPDFGVSHSNNSCSHEDCSITPFSDMEAIVSLKNIHVLSGHDAPPEFYPHYTAIEEATATLQYSHPSPFTAYASSLLNGTAEKDFPHLGSSTLNTKILPENTSEADFADPAVTYDQQLLLQMDSETISDVIPKVNSESEVSEILQVDLSSSGSVVTLYDHSKQGVVKENEHFINLKLLENVKDGQSLAFNDCVEMETKKDIVLGELNPAPDALMLAEHFQGPLDLHAKMVENNVRLEANISKEGLHHCDTMSSFASNANDMFEEPLKTKEDNGGSNAGAVNLNKIDNSLSNTDNSKQFTPSKRHKKFLAPTDRCLRSREAHDDLLLQEIPSLQVLLSYIKDTNSAQRSVELKNENTPCAPTIIDSIVDETSDGENYFAVSLNSHCKDGKPLVYENMLKNTCSSPFKMSENLKICLEIGSDKRMVSFVKENHHNCLSLVDAERNCGATSLQNACPLQLKKCNNGLSENPSYFISRTRSSTKHVALKTLKDKITYCNSGEFRNLTTENKQVNRPKFIDWCSEEENRVRISNFNEKYTTIHKNWITLEKESANVAKSKNKADKLKEIWKTKKRVRRSKSIQDAPRCSPMQMLFMNSVKFSDICRWFMETTETKSLVIVKKLNTRLPEEHQLPVMPSPKYSSQSLYPHTLQAQRLKKHLKKFASVLPARNDIRTQNSFNQLISNSTVPLTQVPKNTVQGPNDRKLSKKTAQNHILQKYSRLRENLKYQSCTVNDKKVCMTNKVKCKAGHTENIKVTPTSEPSLHKVPNSLTSKSPIKNHKNKKRSKKDSSIEPVAQPNKKRKVETKQRFFKNGPQVNKNAVPTKTKVGKLNKIGLTSSSQAPKKQVGKAGVYKTSVRKGRVKTPIQKKSLKSQLKRQTRSGKLKHMSPNLLDSSKMTSLSSSHRKKELHKKICMVSAKNKINVASQGRYRKPRSQKEPPTRKGRSLESK